MNPTTDALTTVHMDSLRLQMTHLAIKMTGIDGRVMAAAVEVAIESMQLHEKVAAVFEKHLSEKEIASIARFYRTPAGKKYAQLPKSSFSELTTLGEQLGAEISKVLQKK